MPGRDMVKVPRRLPDLSDDEWRDVYKKLYDAGNDWNPKFAVYEDISTVFFPSLPMTNLIHQMITRYQSRGLLLDD